ncbi:DNA-binding XRE family transcriptional regulator [Caulobacter ginsengisoli]|uniref:DNA-binding XRE family transcriptional regulator n=1 Tax=Caulobacter ginsengisoli TaxID=400775 RepID=A0ABU0J001_9CAUL|nr:helix-turn-helix transcriptional regulator [Caulobacter ginsengisoli]MDQ0466753.1 DNA-binding XRE family transcriptional regulator [Caulobacter ginsengisoli]
MPIATTSLGLGVSLRRWRVLNRIKQADAAERLGVSQTTISRWETGARAPEGREARRLITLLAARPGSASDRALADLVRCASTPAHLICDFTHRLIAASPARARSWTVGIDELIGTSLWRFASQGIAAGEAGLESRGWYGPLASDIVVATEKAVFPELTIPPG